jgi:tRNA dimethylallyltransferase
MKKYLIVILGPTGIGKTDISIEIALRLNTEIISADSRQFYCEMKIGTAVPDDFQLKRVKHHFIRFLSVKGYYSSSRFERDVLETLRTLFEKIDIVLMTGGSAMYIDAVCNGIDDIPDTDPAIREKYINIFREEGIESLRVALKLLDPEHYSRVDLKNHKRIIRALEICESAGRPYSSFLTKNKVERNFNIIKIGLELGREELYERINKRVDSMVEKGLEKEARQLFEFRDLNALKSVGYTEFFDFFEEKISREKAIELIKRNSRRYAKRQITWWSKDQEIRWFRPGNLEGIIKYISDCIEART